MLVLAQASQVSAFTEQIFFHIVDPAITVLFYATIFWFILHLGIYLFSIEDTKKRENSLKYMFFGIIGIFVVISTSTIFLFLNKLAGNDINIVERIIF